VRVEKMKPAPSVSYFVKTLVKLLPGISKDDIVLEQEYFPYVFCVRTPQPRCKGAAIGAIFSKLSDIVTSYDVDEPLEDELDCTIKDCRMFEDICAYFCDWSYYEREHARHFIDNYRLQHEFKDYKKITDFFLPIKK
jgi:hypothetical protein